MEESLEWYIVQSHECIRQVDHSISVEKAAEGVQVKKELICSMEFQNLARSHGSAFQSLYLCQLLISVYCQTINHFFSRKLREL